MRKKNNMTCSFYLYVYIAFEFIFMAVNIKRTSTIKYIFMYHEQVDKIIKIYHGAKATES